MRSRLLAVTALTLVVIVSVTAGLVYELRQNQSELIALWTRVDNVSDAVRIAATDLGQIDAELAGGRTTARFVSARNDLERQITRLTAWVTEDTARQALTDMRLAVVELGQAAPGDAAVRSAAKLHQAFGRLWMRLSEVSSGDVSRFALRQQRETGRLLLVMVLAAIVGSGFAAYHILRVADLLNQFIVATRRLSQGQMSYRIVPPPARELRELAESFNQMADDLAAAEARRTEAAQEMRVTLSHELGNSLSSISGLVQLLLRHEADLAPSVVSSLSKIQDTVDRLGRVVARLRDFPSLHVAEYPGGLKMFDVSEPADGATAVAPTADRRGPE